jgi:hypothetical protein
MMRHTRARALLGASRTSLVGCLLAGAAIAASGCLNLDDVAGLQKMADAAEQSLRPVVSDFPESCKRQNSLVNDIPSAERPATLKPDDCKPYQDVAEQVSRDQGALIAYFDALGKLASNTPFTYDKKIDTNVAAIGKLPNLSKNVVAASSAAQKLAKDLADIATRRYRSREVNALIEQSDVSVHELTSDLKKVITEDYALLLRNEADVLSAFYDSPIAQAAASKSERLTLVLVQRQYNGDTAALVARQSAAVNYGKVMDSMAALHAKLKAKIHEKAGLRELAKDLAPDITSVKDAVGQLKQELK